MTITRRRFVQIAAALPALSALPRFALAEMALGEATLTTVSDGTLTLPADFIFGPMPADVIASIRAEFGLTDGPLTPECNLALYRDGTNTVLFDAGSGTGFMPSAGILPDSLDALGVSADEITHVIFTHGHPDHLWGVLDDFDDPAFPEAKLMMGRAEWDYWWNPETVNEIGDARAAFAAGARRRMEAIEDQIAFFDDGDEVLPGVAAISTPGHTPGHMSFEIRQGGSAALVIGDAIGNHHVAFQRPDLLSGSDQNKELAAETRKALLDRITSEDLTIVGFHLPGGGMGRAETRGDGYRFVSG
ncbi:MBL fold metallo-hydrolase [Palleronia caenipelagi]|uniref:MBL fold metallo-hydrolase n=1 Tax=Palleronia caenipelagi TaxID=2489174 RepID=A0A547PLZ1_9RHOB|nr:MBL fold metallo-hydrolase [Palleronia caenipelagi]TRD15147.1 MBL fold metallo-hydrolase [Palleronia caenipelagi]